MPNSLHECCDSDTIGDILPPHYWSLEPWSHVLCCPPEDVTAQEDVTDVTADGAHATGDQCQCDPGRELTLDSHCPLLTGWARHSQNNLPNAPSTNPYMPANPAACSIRSQDRGFEMMVDSKWY